ncbi:MAG TPA: ABC transporter permease [Ilumatobacter sp.]|nr:ABC transporter permease [Ilumatobacter sp.]
MSAASTAVTVPRARLAARVLPVELFEARRPQRLLERHFMIVRSGEWMIVLSGFFEPLFYLLSVRVGFGALVGDVVDGGRTVPYAEFVAPALMAASAMNGAVYESTMNIFFKLKYEKTYDSVLNTPMTAPDVALGEIGYAAFRGSLYSGAFLVTMAALGMTSTWWSLLMVPVAILVALSFAAVGMAITTFMRSWEDFEYVTTVTLPLFLFSATFYPAASYGRWQWLLQLSPLYHGVALIRGASYGVWQWSYLGHLAFLLAMFAFGVVLAARRISALILK